MRVIEKIKGRQKSGQIYFYRIYLRVKAIDFKASKLNSFLCQLKAARQRQLLWIQGQDPEFCRARAKQVIQLAAWQQGWWVAACPERLAGFSLPEGVSLLPASSSRKHLGSETQVVVMDAFTGLSPDAWGALAGTLQAGGLLLLLSPEDWANFADPDYRRLAPWPWRPEQLSRRFLSLSQQQLNQAAIAVWPATATQPQWPPVTAVKPAALAKKGWGAKTQDQEQAITQLVEVWQSQRPVPSVLTAHRGRGKSAALGLAAALWLADQPDKKLLVTAPSFAASETLLQHFQQKLADLGRTDLNDQLLRLAPDQLLRQLPAADLILVDEAAALPVPLLQKLLHLSPRIAFASTQQGYEGSGRGFALRFYKHLTEQTPGWLALQLDEPIRWALGDPLESLTNQLLLLDAQPPSFERLSGSACLPQACWLTRDALIKDHQLLRQVFGLLVWAHYRTSPDDLRQLLDTPGVRLAALLKDGQPLALAWIQEEGGMDSELAEAIFMGLRRPQGHLLAQSLSFHAGCPQAVQLKGWRVQRILTHPEMQRQGWGSQLLAWVRSQARSQPQPPDWLGSSFGATPELLPFWKAAGYQPVRLGITRDQASGEHTLQVLQGLTANGRLLQQELQSRFMETLPDQLQGPLNWLPAALVVALYQQLDQQQQGFSVPLTAADRQELFAFTQGHRPWAVSLTALKRWLLQRLALPATSAELSQLALWVSFLLQGQSQEALIEKLQVSGKKQLNQWLRQSCRQLSQVSVGKQRE